MKQQCDDSAKELDGKEKEIKNLENEVKSLIQVRENIVNFINLPAGVYILFQAEKQQREVGEETKAEVDMLRKQIKDLNSKTTSKSESDAQKKKIETQKSEIEKLTIEVKALKKEDKAFDILRKELEQRSQEKSELSSKVEMLSAEVAAKDYDVERTKTDRDSVMAHYDQKLKKVTEELALEKRESVRIREMMAKATPASGKRGGGRSDCCECKLLRDELGKKTEVIKQLEGMIPTPTKTKKK